MNLTFGFQDRLDAAQSMEEVECIFLWFAAYIASFAEIRLYDKTPMQGWPK